MHEPLARVWEEQLDGFELYLKRGRRAKNTRIKYRQQLVALARWAGERPPASLTTQALQFDYIEQWAARFERSHGRMPTARSERNAITAIKSFYSFLDKRGWLVDQEGREIPNPARRIETPPIPRRRNDWLRDSEDTAVQEACATPLERMLIALLRWQGLRIGEAAALKQSDVELTPGAETLHVRVSKTEHGIRSLPIFPEALPTIRVWLVRLEARGLRSPDLPLLVTRNRTAMKAQYLWRVVKGIGLRAGIRVSSNDKGEPVSAVTPHTLRRTFGSHLINLPVRLEVVSKLLGHSSTKVTEDAYAELLDETTRKEALEALRRAS